jgi:hypothetical protein
MGLNAEYSSVIKTVSTWPLEDRITLAQDLLGTLKSDVAQRRTSKNTADQALGIAKGSGPAPTDGEVKQWIDEHRMEKYGR